MSVIENIRPQAKVDRRHVHLLIYGASVRLTAEEIAGLEEPYDPHAAVGFV
jgi:hypothetical protein